MNAADSETCRNLALAWLDACGRVNRGLWASWQALAVLGLEQSGRWVARLTRNPGDEPVRTGHRPPRGRAAEARPAVASARTVDDLSHIHGIGPALHKRLRQAGVRTYAEIACWSDDALDDIERRLMNGVCTGRIRRDDWVGQARRLLEGQG